MSAVQRTNSAGSENVALAEQLTVGGIKLSVHLRGVAKPASKTGSFVFTLSPAPPGFTQASEILAGTKVYVHYDLLDSLHARNPAVRPWILIDTRSNLGVDPSALTTFGVSELSRMTDLEAVRSATVGGVPTTLYAGSLELSKVADSPQLQQLLAHLPSAASVVLHGTERVQFAVGQDGYLHGITASIAVPIKGSPAMRITVTAVFSNFNRSTGGIVAPAAADVMTLDRFEHLLGATTNTGAALLGKVALTPSQVGPGYVESQIPGGQLVQGEPTLDYCGFHYPSEALRTARLQVVYTKKSDSFKLSNEVVTYKTGGAEQALREIAHAGATCPQGLIKHPPSGVTSFIHHSRLVHDPRLLPGAVAILDWGTATVNGKRITSDAMAVYQIRGNVLSGVYGSAPNVATVEARTLVAAERSATNLERSIH